MYMNEKRIPCPDCGEQILSTAQKCRYCGKNLSPKTKKTKTLGKIILLGLAALGILFVVAAAMLFYFITQVDNKYTGQELFDAVNEHRQSINVQRLELDPALCDNLVERWQAIRNPGNAHKGFEEWVVSEGLGNEDGSLKAPYDGGHGIAELYASGTQTYWLIDFWTGSPGHKSSLENPNFNVGCAYASDGTGVLIMAQKEM
jgi:ribosomal protein L40E